LAGGAITLLLALYLFELVARRQGVEAQLRTLIDAMPDIVCFKDGAGRLLEANAFYLRLFGLEGVACRGKTDAELASFSPLHREAFQRRQETDELAWQRGEPIRSDEHISRPDGTEQIFDVIKIPQFDDWGRRQSLVVVGRDVTDRQRAEQQLRQSEEKFARIFHITPDVVVISRLRDGRLLDVNPGFEATTGYSRAEAVGRSSLELGLWADPADRDRLLNDLRQYGQVLYQDFNFRRKDGAVRVGQFSARPLAIDHEPCLLFIMRDVTKHQQAEMALRQRDRLLQAVTDAMVLLLSGHQLNDAIGAALATLGRAVDADRVYVFENHDDPATGAPLMSQRYEWCADGAAPQIDNPELQNLTYEAFSWRWHHTLIAGQAIRGLVREFPETERVILEPQAIRSILVLPIHIDEHFWGFIGFDDCHTDRAWTQIEENILRTAAAAIGDAYLRLRAETALRASEEQYRTLVDNLNIGVYRNTDGPQGRFLQANPAIIQMFGYDESEAEFFQINVPDLYVDPEERQRFMTEILSQGQVTNKALHLRRKDGATFWGALTARVAYDEQGQVKWLDGVIEDITDRRQAEARQRLAAAVFEAARDAILVTDQEGRIVAVNPAFTTLTGYAESEVKEKSPRLLWAERQPETFFEELGETVTREGVWQGEFWARRKDGERRAALASLTAVRDGAGQITHYIGLGTDITALKAAEQRIEHLAYYDALTALPNRALLTQRAELALALAARHGETLAVLFLDLDRFKEVNDSLGHAEGDALLVQVAARLQALIRAEDTVCRLGGDEFVLLLPEAGQEGALRVADKVLAAFRQPFPVAGHHLGATVSIGIALYPYDGADFAELLKNADTALYRAKHEGRNTRVFYDRAMNAATLARMVLEAELRQALQAGQLCTHYQPKVRLADGALVGAEALVRWRHPERGLIPPGQFVPVAEASDLIVDVGDWMLDEVCRQLAAWRRQGLAALTVAINMAARHFRQPGLADRIRDRLDAHGLPAQALELELTESTLLEAGADTAANLAQLERLGVGLSLDDFGTGYSSLSYLKRLPLSALKIDRSFVRDLVTDSDDRTLAATIIALGHHLGLAVVAEGVEAEEQRRFLLEQGCDLAQGYYFSRPLPAEEFAQWLTQAGVARSGSG
jgi:diguanylate cyclase (GGDEF)-like protein/PAS domain S-box-containing protein